MPSYHKVEYKNNKWGVTWDNQDIPWEGWNTSLFVKAKEDFLGGNTASTNEEASFVPESYTTNKGKNNEKKRISLMLKRQRKR